MSELDERKEIHRGRLKENRIQSILDTMKKYEISSKDLVEYEDRNNADKLAHHRSVQDRKLKHLEGLRKAREAREAKRNGKQTEGKDVRPVEVRSQDSDNEE